MAGYTFDQVSNPEAHGLQMCPHCNGYGSSMKDPIGVDRCTQCKGTGLIPKEKTMKLGYEIAVLAVPGRGFLPIIRVDLKGDGQMKEFFRGGNFLQTAEHAYEHAQSYLVRTLENAEASLAAGD